MKKNTLYYLEKANGNYVSGESIAESLGVSRMTVSKEVAAPFLDLILFAPGAKAFKIP